MNLSDLAIGNEYRYLDQPVTLTEIVSDSICVVKTRFEEFTTCEVNELRPWTTAEVTSVLPRRNAIWSEGQ